MELITLKYQDVVVGERFRSANRDIEKLMESIREFGIIQSIAVKDLGSRRYQLLAGGRRIAAIKMLKDVYDVDLLIPARVYENEAEYSTDIHNRKIELEENIQRQDLSWQEVAQLRAEILRLETEIQGSKTERGNQYYEALGVSKAEVAKLIGIGQSTLRTDAALAEAMELIPSLAKCKSKDEAIKVMRKLSRDITAEEEVKRLQDVRAATPMDRTRKQLIDSFIIEDFLIGVKKLKSNMIDIAEIDPPYAIDLKHKKKEVGVHTLTMDYNEIDVREYKLFMEQTLNETYRVMRENSWLIVWFAPEPWFETIYQLILRAGKPENVHIDEWIKSSMSLKCLRMPGIWTKGSGQTNQPDLYLPNTYEMFFYARKGNAIIQKPGRSNEFDFKPVPPLQKPHPTTRPIELMQEILLTFVKPGSRVMVPFLGSGYTLLAANNLLMEGFGYELSEIYKNEFTLKVYSELPQHYRSC